MEFRNAVNALITVKPSQSLSIKTCTKTGIFTPCHWLKRLRRDGEMAFMQMTLGERSRPSPENSPEPVAIGWYASVFILDSIAGNPAIYIILDITKMH